jgi:signal recognition particle subunit SRP54
MFELLTDKLTNIFSKLNDQSRITDQDLDTVMREVRIALLEADVNFQTVRTFIQTVRGKATDVITLESLTPGQNIIRIVQEELTSILGSSEEGIAEPSGMASPILLVGLQGSGKTTTAAKLALHFQRLKQSVNLVACDLLRPAAADQLEILGKQIDVPVYKNVMAATPTVVALEGISEGQKQGAQYTIIDTAGRLQTDDALMTELEELVTAIHPIEILLVIDSMTGQEALSVATEINSRVPLTGLIMTKMDGDARGGAALSIRHMSGIPIKFFGTGEQLNMLDIFHPDRLSSRILGMGDVLSLVEKAQATIGNTNIESIEKKMRTATFDLDDFLVQLQQVRKMGPISQMLDMLPGSGQIKKKLGNQGLNVDETRLSKVEAIIYSMTVEERQSPSIINGSRRRRIAKGSGTTAQDINQLLSQFKQMQQMMKQFAKQGSKFTSKTMFG